MWCICFSFLPERVKTVDTSAVFFSWTGMHWRINVERTWTLCFLSLLMLVVDPFVGLDDAQWTGAGRWSLMSQFSRISESNEKSRIRSTNWVHTYIFFPSWYKIRKWGWPDCFLSSVCVSDFSSAHKDTHVGTWGTKKQTKKKKNKKKERGFNLFQKSTQNRCQKIVMFTYSLDTCFFIFSSFCYPTRDGITRLERVTWVEIGKKHLTFGEGAYLWLCFGRFFFA